METSECAEGYLLAAALGAIGGGLAVIVAARVISKTMTWRMSGMMRAMSEMGSEGCHPADM
jgi:hypothetical protein